MIGAQGLKSAPETMFHMECYHDHGKKIEGHVSRMIKDTCHNLKNGSMGLVHEVECEEMNDDKYQEVETRVGHEPGTPGPAPCRFFHDIPRGSCPKVFKIKQGAGAHVDQCENQQAPFRDIDQ